MNHPAPLPCLRGRAQHLSLLWMKMLSSLACWRFCGGGGTGFLSLLQPTLSLPWSILHLHPLCTR